MLVRFPQPIYDNVVRVAGKVKAPASDFIQFCFIWGYQQEGLEAVLLKAFANYKMDRTFWYSYRQDEVAKARMRKIKAAQRKQKKLEAKQNELKKSVQV